MFSIKSLSLLTRNPLWVLCYYHICYLSLTYYIFWKKTTNELYMENLLEPNEESIELLEFFKKKDAGGNLSLIKSK